MHKTYKIVHIKHKNKNNPQYELNLFTKLAQSTKESIYTVQFPNKVFSVPRHKKQQNSLTKKQNNNECMIHTQRKTKKQRFLMFSQKHYLETCSPTHRTIQPDLLNSVSKTHNFIKTTRISSDRRMNESQDYADELKFKKSARYADGDMTPKLKNKDTKFKTIMGTSTQEPRAIEECSQTIANFVRKKKRNKIKENEKIEKEMRKDFPERKINDFLPMFEKSQKMKKVQRRSLTVNSARNRKNEFGTLQPWQWKKEDDYVLYQ